MNDKKPFLLRHVLAPLLRSTLVSQRLWGFGAGSFMLPSRKLTEVVAENLGWEDVCFEGGEGKMSFW